MKHRIFATLLAPALFLFSSQLLAGGDKDSDKFVPDPRVIEYLDAFFANAAFEEDLKKQMLDLANLIGQRAKEFQQSSPRNNYINERANFSSFLKTLHELTADKTLEDQAGQRIEAI